MQVFQCDVKGCTYTANSREFFKHITIKSDTNPELSKDLSNKDICPEHAVKIFNMLAEQFKNTMPYEKIQQPAKPAEEVTKKTDNKDKSAKKKREAEPDNLSKEMYNDYYVNGMSQRDIAIKYNRSQAVVSRRIKLYKEDQSTKQEEVSLDKAFTPEHKKEKNVEVLAAGTSKPDTLKGFNKSKNAQADKLRLQKCGATVTGTNTMYIAAYVDMYIGHELAATVATRHDIPLEHMLSNFKSEEARYESIIKSIAKLYAGGVPVKVLSIKYRLNQDAIIAIVLKKVNHVYHRKDVDKESKVYTNGDNPQLDVGGILALYNAGWLIDDIVEEKGCEVKDVVSVINTTL